MTPEIPSLPCSFCGRSVVFSRDKGWRVWHPRRAKKGVERVRCGRCQPRSPIERHHHTTAKNHEKPGKPGRIICCFCMRDANFIFTVKGSSYSACHDCGHEKLGRILIEQETSAYTYQHVVQT